MFRNWQKSETKKAQNNKTVNGVCAAAAQGLSSDIPVAAFIAFMGKLNDETDEISRRTKRKKDIFAILIKYIDTLRQFKVRVASV